MLTGPAKMQAIDQARMEAKFPHCLHKPGRPMN